MDIDSAAIWYATRSDKSWLRAKELGIAPHLFKGTAKAAWKFLEDYHASHGDVPGVGVVVEQTGASVHEPDEEERVDLSYVADQLFKRHEWRCLQHGLTTSLEHLEEGEQDEAIAEVHKLHDALIRVRGESAQVTTLAQEARSVLEMYERTKRGEIGTPFPWDAMNDMTLGMWPKTLTFFVARPGVGKTWTAIIIALHVWLLGVLQNVRRKVLVISPEMSRVELAERMVAKYGAISYGDLVAGTLGAFGEPALKNTIEDLEEKAQDLYILDDEERLQPEYIEAAIDEIEPELVVFDAVYLMRVDEGKVKKGPGSKGGRYDRIHETVDWMRRLCRRKDVPILGISQLSRQGKVRKGARHSVKQGKGTGGLEDALAFTDTLLMDVHNLFAVWQDADMRLDKQLMFVPLKVRRRARSSHVVINWDMEQMNFDQIGTKVDSVDDSDDDSGSKRSGKGKSFDEEFNDVPF